MTIEDLLLGEEAAILDEATHAVAELEHYRRDGAQATRGRLELLHRHLVDAVLTRDLNALRAHVTRMAHERFAGGFDVTEVQAAFSALEDAIWRKALSRLPPDERAWGLSLVGTVLAQGGSTLARTFESLAPRAPEPCVDLTPLFLGADAVRTSRSVEELVYPV
ncbi:MULTISPECIES: hypothetical protein [Anaeromyxobacter]|uniref:hypothetical protein n=1 Tax=Anaeromyxobacter TaxID=161492 RepID=UPI001F56F6F2|nr:MULTISPECIES: hypothetical protein [unclassified Anaeromyxobacter]